MRVIKTFPWCKNYGIEYVDVNFLTSKSFRGLKFTKSCFVYEGCKIHNLKHITETYDWLTSFEEIKGNRIKNIVKWYVKSLIFSFSKNHNKRHLTLT